MKSVKRLFSLVFIFIFHFVILYSQNDEKMNYKKEKSSELEKFLEFRMELQNIIEMRFPILKREAVDSLWYKLKATGDIPFRAGNYAAFLYRGEAESVTIQGDFTGWGRMRSTDNSAIRIKDTDLWFLEKEFPSDARIDYKIVINGKTWILDPNNPLTQMSGFGNNSELRMPDWKPSPWIVRDSKIPEGKVTEDIRIKSKLLGYDLQYRVYLPFGYEQMKNLPVIYVTDGHEYSHDDKGSMLIVLDNLIYKGLINPVIAVFIDPRDPDDLNMNRRESQFLMNERYLNFVCEELVPKIDAEYKTSKYSKDRAILGTSYGGVCATYFALMRSNVFHLVAIQSPAYGGAMKLDSIYKGVPKLPLKIFMSSGTINDGETLTRMVKSKYEQDGYEILYKEVNEGHSWGNWRALIDDMLIYFWGR